jgi:hypothetical protein
MRTSYLRLRPLRYAMSGRYTALFFILLGGLALFTQLSDRRSFAPKRPAEPARKMAVGLSGAGAGDQALREPPVRESRPRMS